MKIRSTHMGCHKGSPGTATQNRGERRDDDDDGENCKQNKRSIPPSGRPVLEIGVGPRSGRHLFGVILFTARHDATLLRASRVMTVCDKISNCLQCEWCLVGRFW